MNYDALALFSGGLDSILAAKLMQSLGHKVLGLHFISPFFGQQDQIQTWTLEYAIPIEGVDISHEYVQLLIDFPTYGFGQVLNPCVDCKVLMLRQAKALLSKYKASFIISGEVLGQRPMSQRTDALNIIRNQAGVRDVLLRPLSAGLLPPTPMEESGLVDRSRLLRINGRGRREQYALAKTLGITKIPAQSGGCRLAERESARRYWPVLRLCPEARLFEVANVGRQLWRRFDEEPSGHWLVVGRQHEDNERLLALSGPKDLQFTLKDFPGPLALAPYIAGLVWTDQILVEAAACLVSFAPKARTHRGPVDILVKQGQRESIIQVEPGSEHDFMPPLAWDKTREEQKLWSKGRDIWAGPDLKFTPGEVQEGAE
ncbi:MAG: tRNA(5-methylaminomethyl-2-thiouridylate) methyltransferase [Desulfomicrobium sp.]|nr:tRNA(5-methylaminomethyl-2-thiouridylate) methyltransferase [Desulfomicrobium sp.]